MVKRTEEDASEVSCAEAEQQIKYAVFRNLDVWKSAGTERQVAGCTLRANYRELQRNDTTKRIGAIVGQLFRVLPRDHIDISLF